MTITFGIFLLNEMGTLLCCQNKSDILSCLQ